jgi:hypothetical protein
MSGLNLVPMLFPLSQALPSCEPGNEVSRDSTANRPAKKRQNHEKIFLKKFISDLLTQIF